MLEHLKRLVMPDVGDQEAILDAIDAAQQHRAERLQRDAQQAADAAREARVAEILAWDAELRALITQHAQLARRFETALAGVPALVRELWRLEEAMSATRLQIGQAQRELRGEAPSLEPWCYDRVDVRRALYQVMEQARQKGETHG